MSDKDKGRMTGSCWKDRDGLCCARRHGIVLPHLFLAYESLINTHR
jgi:hypothetical protein